MFDRMRPIEDMKKVLNTPINLAESTSINRAANSIYLAAGARIHVNDGYVLTVKPQGVEVHGEEGYNPYDQEAYLKAQQMATSLETMLRNAGGTMSRLAHSTEGHQWVSEGITNVLSYLGIDTGKDFYVNGMKYAKNSKGYFESEATTETQAAYERQKAANRTYEFADERTRKQIAYHSVLQQLAAEQDFLTGGNDNLFGDSLQSSIDAVNRILERIDNLLAEVTEENAVVLQQEKEFYQTFLNKLESL